MNHRNMILLGLIAAFTSAAATLAAAPAGGEGPPPVTALSMMASALPSSDLDRSIAFYTQGLGMTLAGRIEMPSGTEAPLMLPGGGAFIMLFKPKAGGSVTVTPGAYNRIVLAVPDLKALEAKLIAAGYHLKAPILEQSKYHVAVGQLEDPDGNHLELVQRTP